MLTMNITPTGSKILISLSGSGDSMPDDEPGMGSRPVRGKVVAVGPEYGKKSDKMEPYRNVAPRVSIGDEVVCYCCGHEVFDDGGESVAFIDGDRILGVVARNSAKKLSGMVGEKKKKPVEPEADDDSTESYGEGDEMNE